MTYLIHHFLPSRVCSHYKGTSSHCHLKVSTIASTLFFISKYQTKHQVCFILHHYLKISTTPFSLFLSRTIAPLSPFPSLTSRTSHVLWDFLIAALFCNLSAFRCSLNNHLFRKAYSTFSDQLIGTHNSSSHLIWVSISAIQRDGKAWWHKGISDATAPNPTDVR